MNRFFEMKADDVPFVLRETLHFMGYPYGSEADESVLKLVEESALEMRAVLHPKLVYDEFPCEVIGDNESACGESGKCEKQIIKIGDFEIVSNDLAKNLSGCKSVILFASTIGSEVDRLIKKYQKTDVAKAAVLQATGAMFIESFVDTFNEKIKTETETSGGKTKPRYSPGYGDVSLETQKQFFKYLDCRKIGLTLMDTLIMAPEKSVTAFIGII